jgi:2-alkyl-3-oxoalkanoate reductase
VSGRRVLVTGATGLIGRALVRSLLAGGAAVGILTRGGRSLPSEWAGRVDVRVGDVTDGSSLAPALAGCGALFHLAGELRDPERFTAVNDDGTRTLLEAARAAEIAHVVHMSSAGVMGIETPGPVDERAPCHPRDGYEVSKYAAEQHALEWSARTGVPVAALRPTIVFGARAGDGPDSFLAFLRAIGSGRFRFIGRSAVANYVYAEDVVAASRAAADRRASGVFIVADPCPLADFVAAAAAALGVAPPRGSVPRPAAYAIAAALEAAGAVAGRAVPLTRARVHALSTRTEFRSIRIGTALGWAPAVGYREGLRRTVAAYRAAGKLPAR